MRSDRFRLYDAAGLAPVLDAMARQIAQRWDGTPLVLIGVLRRGAPLADMLATRVSRLVPAARVERTDLRVKRYSDDLNLLHPETSLTPTPEQAISDFAGKRVIVVDDVLYQGYSIFRVLEFLRSHGAGAVHVAVLVDREVTRLPIRADFVGLRLQIAPEDVIECNVPPFEADFAVDLWRPGANPAVKSAVP